MGNTPTKQRLVCGVETLELVDHVCDAAEKLAAARCGKYSVEVFKHSSDLRGQRQQWSAWQAEAEQLHGRQVFAVAAALQSLSTKMEWCKRKLHQRHLVSMRTLSSCQQAGHILQVLAAAQEAFANFSTAFRLAVMLSREQQASATGSQQQQRQQQQERQAGSSTGVKQQEQLQVAFLSEPGAQEKAEQEQEQEHAAAEAAGSEAEEACQQEAEGGGGPAADAACSIAMQPPCAPASCISSPQATPQPGCMATAASPAAASAAQTATAAAGVEPASQQGGIDAAAAADGAAEWEHSQEGWQELLQQAWRGDGGAVLACAQQLIHGGDFCLQDLSLARQLLHTTVHQPCGGTACLWLGQMCERGLGLPAPDYEAAAAWYGQGAGAGHLECAQALAFYYQHGLGLQQDEQAALEWYEFPAEGGLASAQNNLGQLLLQGVGGAPADAAAALQLFRCAAEQGSAAAWFNLGMCHELGLTGGTDGRPDAAAAEACYSNAGTAKALLRLGHLHLQQHDTSAAGEAFTAAAEAGSAEALLQLAKLRSKHLSQQQLPPGVGATLGAARSLGATGCSASSGGCGANSSNNSLSSSTGSSSSSFAVEASAGAALQLYHKAAEAGAAEAQHVVGCVCWSKGQVAAAMSRWHAAAAQGYGPALMCLAAAAEKGLQGVRQDSAAARACYTMAAASGCKEAGARVVVLDREATLQSSSWHTLQQPWDESR